MTNLNPHFFRRDEDGSVRIRMRFTKQEADQIEAAAMEEPLVSFMHGAVMGAAARQAKEADDARHQRLLSRSY